MANTRYDIELNYDWINIVLLWYIFLFFVKFEAERRCPNLSQYFCRKLPKESEFNMADITMNTVTIKSFVTIAFLHFNGDGLNSHSSIGNFSIFSNFKNYFLVNILPDQ
jgi:hypothetical protein